MWNWVKYKGIAPTQSCRCFGYNGGKHLKQFRSVNPCIGFARCRGSTDALLGCSGPEPEPFPVPCPGKKCRGECPPSGSGNGSGCDYCTLSTSTSKIRVAFGPMTGPLPFGP